MRYSLSQFESIATGYVAGKLLMSFHIKWLRRILTMIKKVLLPTWNQQETVLVKSVTSPLNTQ